MEEDENEATIDMNILKTRAMTHNRILDATPQTSGKKKGMRKINQIKCQSHHELAPDDSWSSLNSNCSLCYKFVTTVQVSNKVLPRVKDVLNLVCTFKSSSKGHDDAYPLRECSYIISQQWIDCNVYPQCIRTTERDN